MNVALLLPLPIVLPLFAAGVLLVLGRRRNAQAWTSVAIMSIVLVTSIILLIGSADGPVVLDVGNWAAPVGISLVADRLSTIMLATSVAVTLLVLIYSIFQGVADGERGAPTAVYYPAFMILSAGVSDAFLTGDLFNMYVGFEMLLTASFVLLTMGGTSERMRSGSVYVIVSLVSSMIFLAGLGMTYAAVGTVNMADLAIKLPEIDPGIRLILQVMFLVAFGLKAAIFPLSAWLPDSYPTASGPVTAVFAGLLTKVGVYAIIRTQFLLFPGGKLDTVLGVFAIVTMVVGILGAIAQENAKRLLSFTLVSHIGYLIWGVSIGNAAGLSSTIFYAIHHIVVQTALFLVVGLIGWVAGTTSLVKLGSIMKAAPVVAVLYFLPAISLGGIPPFSGFLGKIGLIEASAERATGLDYALIAAGLITSLLTLYAVIRVWNMAFWQEAPEELPDRAYPGGMVATASGLVALMLTITVCAAPIRSFTDGAATELLQRTPYISAVLPDYKRGSGISPEVAEKDPVPTPEPGATPSVKFPFGDEPTQSGPTGKPSKTPRSTPSPAPTTASNGGETR
ncbi:monovalent cation/H+ antiporter subunit D [Actinobaculum suis]|uniref:Monovalent cation/H+ antiporter subunit D n=1 Tax=Actinobaculum suis TaxID=1657 RepID=A0A7Z9C7N8_9ACTO|nr:Na+/H+ antiporter subunit D [Actinobaculum suis]VDG75547.1 monovalent cation/H+ antiporter subunit D [Actinobaculum suis]